MKLASNVVLDFRYALRALRRSPAVALTAVLAIAIGIGASTAVFSVVDRILFRSLPYTHAGQIVVFGLLAPIEPREFMLGADYLEWKSAQQPFESMAAYGFLSDCDLTEERPMRLACLDVERTFLPTLGVAPVLGRNFAEDEDRPPIETAPPPVNHASGISSDGGVPRAALISYALWRGRFGGDPAVVDRTMSLDGHDVRIVGVLPHDFDLPTPAHADVLVPLALNPATNRHPNTGRVLRDIARLRPGLTPAQAEQALEPLYRDSLRYVPTQFVHEVKLSVRTLRERQMGDARLGAIVLLCAVIAVLLIACANVANLLLARATVRARERAVRSALGAGRWRLISAAMAESTLLALSGGLGGVALAYGLLRLLVRFAPQAIPRLEQASLDLRVLGFALAACGLSAVLFGMAPALQRPQAEQLSGGRAVAGSRGGLRDALVAAQIAACIVLLSAASLLLRSLWRMQAEPLGLDSEHVITAKIALGRQRYSTAEGVAAFYDGLEQRLQRIAGVEALGISDSLPPMGAMRSRIFAEIAVAGQPRFQQGTGGMVGWRAVTPDYFRALNIHMVRGRGFVEADREPSANAMIVNQMLAQRLFGQRDPVGQRVSWGFIAGPVSPEMRWFTVVGVAADVKNNGINEIAGPEYYIVRHSAQDATATSYVSVRSGLSSDAVSRWIRSEVAAIDPTLPVEIETMDERVSKLMAAPRFDALLLGIFAAMALLLAAIGLYGVMAFLVAQRTQEIGVRMALGATPGEIAKFVLGRAARWTFAGAVVGLAASLAGTRVIESLLYHVHPRDPLALGASLIVLVSVAMLAAFVPARRAAAVDPVVALRHE